MEILQGTYKGPIMKNELVKSAAEGFIGSFKLAATIVMALVAVISVFVNGDVGADQHPQSKIHQ